MVGDYGHAWKIRNEQQTVAKGIVFFCINVLLLGIPWNQVKILQRAFDALHINKETWAEIYKYEVDVLGLILVVASDAFAFLVWLN